MANPLVLFENIYETAGATVTITSEDASGSFDKENLTDWRLATPYRWKANGTASQNYDITLAGTASPDTVAIGGHNMATVGAGYRVFYSDNGADYTALHATVTPTDNLPTMTTFATGAHQYWRVRFLTGPFSASVSAGIITLGRKLDLNRGALPGFDAYGVQSVVEDASNENGSPIGVNVRYQRKVFRLDYSDIGMLNADLFTPASGLGIDDDFVPHALNSGKPFWFNWNTDVQANVAWLCKTRNIAMPFIQTNLRRGLIMDLEAFREVA